MRLNSENWRATNLAFAFGEIARPWLAPNGHGEQDDNNTAAGPESAQSEHDDLPYKIELWDQGETIVERVLAVTSSGSIGYAALAAAAQEYPGRYITLRHKSKIISQSPTMGA